jgi:SAM-dependent MidA family methyltransferase
MTSPPEHLLPLRDRLLRRIETDGPVTFAAFMDSALYDPQDGFYSRPPIGVSGHYVTSPHVSVAFADLIVRQLVECWGVLGRPATMAVVEAGAGDGTLAAQILASEEWPAEGKRALRYVAVERSRGARNAVAARGVNASASLRDVEPFTGVLLANELLDNVPFHRLRDRGGAVVEVLVGVAGGRFVEVEGPPSESALAALGTPLEPGEERPVSPLAASLVGEVSDVLERGYSFLFDYGFSGGVGSRATRAYRGQEVLSDVVADPGSRDISAGVDFDALIRAAKGHGLDVWGPVSQRDAMLNLGLRAWLRALRSRQAAAEARGDHRLAVRLFGERTRAPMLVDEAQLGSLQLIVFGRGVPAPGAVKMP